MNIKNALRLLAVALIVAPGVRLLADTASLNAEADGLSARNFFLNMYGKDIQETDDRIALRDARQKAAAQAAALSAANFDKNHDGKLDETEFAAWMAAVRQAVVKSPEAMKRFDKNHDGKLDDAEWAAASAVLLGKA